MRVRSFVRLLAHSLACSLVYLFVYLFVRVFVRLLVRLLVGIGTSVLELRAQSYLEFPRGTDCSGENPRRRKRNVNLSHRTVEERLSLDSRLARSRSLQLNLEHWRVGWDCAHLVIRTIFLLPLTIRVHAVPNRIRDVVALKSRKIEKLFQVSCGRADLDTLLSLCS